MLLASFPSPGRSVWDLGPIPIRAYALCIIAGIVAAIWMGERRWVARGGRRGTVSDVAVWAVIFGLIGGRLYHVITDNELYFRAGRDPWRAFYIWEGGLGVWGAIALGGVGAWIACHRRGIKLPPFADACAPGIAVAQGIGRWGNYFNQELFGRPTNVPWAVRIDPDRPSTVPGVTTYHPTFLYESLWDLALAAALIWADRRWKMGRGRVFALYVMGYTAGRVWIEMLRIDTTNHVLGLRLNVWTSILVFAGGLVYFLLHPGPREAVVEPAPDGGPADGPAAEGATADDTAEDAAEDASPGQEAAADATTGDEAAAEDATAGDEATPDKATAGATAKDVKAADVKPGNGMAGDRMPGDAKPGEVTAGDGDGPDDEAAVERPVAAGRAASAEDDVAAEDDGAAEDGAVGRRDGAPGQDAARDEAADEGSAVAAGSAAVGATEFRRRRLLPAGRRKR